MGKTIIFDLDGTLADTSGDLIAAANACFERDWLDPSADQRWAFRGGRAMLRLALERQGRDIADANAEIERLFPRLLEYYADNLDRFTFLYAGVEDAVIALDADGWRLGVCTNKPVGLAKKLLKRLDLDRYFGAILGADSLPVRKPDPRHLYETIDAVGGHRDMSLLVGDTETDRDTARNAGVPCILVGFGPDGPGVSELEPDAVLGDYADLRDLARRLCGT